MSEEAIVKEESYYLSHRLSEFHYDLFKDLTGRLCTLVDSSVQNDRQVKAMKDIVKQILWEQGDRMRTTDERILFDFSKIPEGKMLPE